MQQAYVIVFGSLGLVFGLLYAERVLVRRLCRRIPVRIVVLGTRGKSSVVRLIAYGVRAAGHRVLYKTTGSRPVLGNVDGTERAIGRRARATPLEQRRVLYAAVRQGADVAVVEAMSIRPESLCAEVRRILAPKIVVVTNVGRDHINDISDPYASFAAAVPDSAVVIAAMTVPPELCERLARRDVRVQEVEPAGPSRVRSILTYEEWEENAEMALAACAAVGVSPDTAFQGMHRVVADFGALTAWRLATGSAEWIVVNGFAANDPDATRRVLQRAIERWGAGRAPLVGLLNLRRDRGDRTIQWLETLVRDPWPFDRLVVAGHSPWRVRSLLRRTLGRRVVFATAGGPEHVMETVIDDVPGGGLVFGFGNLAGIGARLVDDWRKRGETM